MMTRPSPHRARVLTFVSLALLFAPLGCEQGGKATPDESTAKSAPESATAEGETEAPAAVDTASPTEEPDAEEPTAEAPAEATGTPTADRAPEAKPPSDAPSDAKDPVKPTGPVAGKQWTAVASASAEKGYKCNDAYPAKFIAEGGSNVDYPSKKVPGGCAGKKSVSVTVPYIAKAAGPGSVAGTLKYGICDEGKTNCRVIQKPVTLAFTAAAK